MRENLKTLKLSPLVSNILKEKKLNISLANILDIYEIDDLNSLCFNVPWTLDGLRKDIDNPISQYILLRDENNFLLGYIALWIVFDESQIINIAIHPLHQNKGYATILMNVALNISKNKNTNFMTLEVRESNTAAKRLYENFKFRVDGMRRSYYKNPTETAILMSLEY